MCANPFYRAVVSLIAKTMRAKRGLLEDGGTELGAGPLVIGVGLHGRPISGCTWDTAHGVHLLIASLDAAPSRASSLQMRPAVPVTGVRSRSGSGAGVMFFEPRGSCRSWSAPAGVCQVVCAVDERDV
jgi:hypothetical protein